jgi:hypothetical protein
MRTTLDEFVELIKVGVLDKDNDKRILSNIRKVENKNYLTGRFFEPLIYKEFEKVEEEGYEINFDEPWFGRGGEYTTGIRHSRPTIGEGMILTALKYTNSIRTSSVRAIITDNLFITDNSVYFLNTPDWRKKVMRDNKLKEILKDEKSS